MATPQIRLSPPYPVDQIMKIRSQPDRPLPPKDWHCFSENICNLATSYFSAWSTFSHFTSDRNPHPDVNETPPPNLLSIFTSTRWHIVAANKYIHHIVLMNFFRIIKERKSTGTPYSWVHIHANKFRNLPLILSVESFFVFTWNFQWRSIIIELVISH